MEASQVFAVRCDEAPAVIQIDGQTFAETAAHLGLVTFAIQQALDLMAAVIRKSMTNGEVAHEEIDQAWSVLFAIKPAATVLFAEHVRWATEQGLHFTIEKPSHEAGPSQAH